MATVSIYVNQEQAAFVCRQLREILEVVPAGCCSTPMLLVVPDYRTAFELAVEFLEEAEKK
jgi:hypothetical protein